MVLVVSDYHDTGKSSVGPGPCTVGYYLCYVVIGIATYLFTLREKICTCQIATPFQWAFNGRRRLETICRGLRQTDDDYERDAQSRCTLVPKINAV